jgi:hypothetical protein
MTYIRLLRVYRYQILRDCYAVFVTMHRYRAMMETVSFLFSVLFFSLFRIKGLFFCFLKYYYRQLGLCFYFGQSL